METTAHLPSRRVLLGAGGATLAALALPLPAATRRPIAPMTDGPFYPPRAWREKWSDRDADLSRVQSQGAVLIARGEHLGLELQVIDTAGRPVDDVEVEIWQCDALAAYRHPGVRSTEGRFDPGFQGYGAACSERTGSLRFRTIRPVPYPGRTPHIHVKLRHPSFGEATSQLFVADDPGNARDFLWRALEPADRRALEMLLQPASADSGLRWQVRHTLVVPA